MFTESNLTYCIVKSLFSGDRFRLRIPKIKELTADALYYSDYEQDEDLCQTSLRCMGIVDLTRKDCNCDAIS